MTIVLSILTVRVSLAADSADQQKDASGYQSNRKYRIRHGVLGIEKTPNNKIQAEGRQNRAEGNFKSTHNKIPR